MGVIWLCGVRPAGYTRTLIFYVLTIHFFTPAEQLLNLFKMRQRSDGSQAAFRMRENFIFMGKRG